MGLHLTPNEPSDWIHGPDDPELGECPDCDGTGDNQDDPEYRCPKCGGSGVVEPPEYDPEPSRSDFD